MKVKELIEKLKEHDQEADVCGYDVGFSKSEYIILTDVLKTEQVKYFDLVKDEIKSGEIVIICWLYT